MKEVIYYLILGIIVFCLIDVVKGAILFESRKEDGSSFRRTILEK